MNTLGPALSTEIPLPRDEKFAAEVAAWRKRSGASADDAVLFATLAGLRNPGAEVKTLLEGARAGRLMLTADAKSQWMGQLAKRLFGPHGPIIEGLR